MRKSCFWILLICMPFISNAQVVEAGLFGGGSLYNGDVSSKRIEQQLKDLGPAAGVFVRLQISKSLSVRTAFSYARIAGNENQAGGTLDNGRYFFSQLQEVSMLGEWKIFHIGRGAVQVAPFLAFGVAGFHFDPKIALNGQEIRLRPLGTEGQGLQGYQAPYSLYQWSVPMGGGLQVSINDRWSIGLELIGRRSQTDYLDDVSDQVVRYWDILLYRGSLAAYISNPTVTPDNAPIDLTYQRGRGFTDWYFMGGLTIARRLFGNYGGKNSSVSCPKF